MSPTRARVNECVAAWAVLRAWGATRCHAVEAPRGERDVGAAAAARRAWAYEAGGQSHKHRRACGAPLDADPHAITTPTTANEDEDRDTAATWGGGSKRKRGSLPLSPPLLSRIREPRYLSVFATGKAARTTRARKTTTKMFCKN